MSMSEKGQELMMRSAKLAVYLDDAIEPMRQELADDHGIIVGISNDITSDDIVVMAFHKSNGPPMILIYSIMESDGMFVDHEPAKAAAVMIEHIDHFRICKQWHGILIAHEEYANHRKLDPDRS